MSETPCHHITSITSVRHAASYQCDECIKTGSRWLHLRTCQECGATLCCDSSPNKHARKHARESGHPVAASAEPGERWLYCFQDRSYADY